MVRSKRGLKLETMTRGYRFRKMVAVSSTIDAPVAAKAHPSSLSRISHPAAETEPLPRRRDITVQLPGFY
jgi:hypothetical protein